MQRNKKIQLLLDMQEHPELFSEQALKAMLDDPEVHELMEATATLKQAMASEELIVKSEEFAAADTEWQRFSATHFSEERTKRGWLKVAASIIGVLMMSGIAFAAIHIARQMQKPTEHLMSYTTAVANSSLFTIHSSLP